MSKKKPFTHTVSGKQGRKALTSPIRLEILGQFTGPEGMSIAEVAGRMGRTPSSLYYHFQILEAAGLLKRVGSRDRGRTQEALFEPVASRIAMAVEQGSESGMADVRKVLGSAFRMAERDLAAAIESGNHRQTGPRRNFFATRMHCRLTPKVLGELNKHLKAIETLMMREAGRRRIPADADQFVSLTLALLPLRGREAEDDPDRS